MAPNWKSLGLSFAKLGVDDRVPAVAPNLSGYASGLNGYFTIRGSFKTRPGHTAFGASFANSNPVDGLFDLWILGETHYVLAVQSGILWSYDFGTNTWTPLSLTNPVTADYSLATAAGAGLAIGTWYYWITGTNQQGETLPAGPLSITLSAASDIQVTVDSLAALGDWGFKVYRSSSATPSTAQLVYTSPLSAGTVPVSWTDAGGVGSSALPATDTSHFTIGQFLTFAVLNNQVCFGNGLDHNYMLDLVANTLTDLTISQGLNPCQYWITHGERIYSSGNRYVSGGAATESRVFWCGSDDPADWTSAGNAGFVDAAKGNDIVSGLASYNGDVFIFKGPRYPQILILTGTAYNNFVLQPWLFSVTGFHRTIVNVSNDVLFQFTDGVYSLARLLGSAGDLNAARVSSALIPSFTALPVGQIMSSCAVWYEPENVAVFYVNTTGASYLTGAFSVGPPQDAPDFTQGYFRWCPWTVPALWTAVPYALNSNQFSVLVGAFDSAGHGAVFLWDFANDTDNGTNFPCSLQTPYIYMGLPIQQKQIKNLSMTLSSNGPIVLSVQDSDANVAISSVVGSSQTTDLWQASGEVWTGSGELWAPSMAQFYNLPLSGASRAFQMSFSKITNAFEIYEASLYYLVGGPVLT